MKVYLNDPICDSAYLRLKSRVEIVDNYDHPEELDAIIVRQQYCTREVISRAVKCRLIQQHGTGLDRIDLEAAREFGIPVQNTPGVNARSVAEYTVALMLGLSRKIDYIDARVREGRLPRFGMPETVGREMFGKTLGLAGSGWTARETARIAVGGFGMRVLCYSRHRTPSELRKLGFIPTDTLEDLFARCDYVSLHTVLSRETYHMIDEKILLSARPGLILVNTARGGLVDETALYHALVSGTIGAAGLDVFEKQPPDPSSPLLKLDNFIAGMHVAGSTAEAMEENGNLVVDKVFAALGITEDRFSENGHDISEEGAK